MRECCRQVEAEVVSMSRNKIHQTWGSPISGALYMERHLQSCKLSYMHMIALFAFWPECCIVECERDSAMQQEIISATFQQIAVYLVSHTLFSFARMPITYVSFLMRTNWTSIENYHKMFRFSIPSPSLFLSIRHTA